LGSDGDFLTADTNYSGAVYYDRNDAGYAIASHDAAGYSDFCGPAGEYAVGGGTTQLLIATRAAIRRSATFGTNSRRGGRT
jgi:hypothetical protein